MHADPWQGNKRSRLTAAPPRALRLQPSCSTALCNASSRCRGCARPLWIRSPRCWCVSYPTPSLCTLPPQPAPSLEPPPPHSRRPPLPLGALPCPALPCPCPALPCSPRPASPRFASPRLASPRLASPRGTVAVAVAIDSTRLDSTRCLMRWARIHAVVAIVQPRSDAAQPRAARRVATAFGSVGIPGGRRDEHHAPAQGSCRG